MAVNFAYPSIGYWVEKDAQGNYIKRPVHFIFSNNRLLGMVTPDGRTKYFQTVRTGHTYQANACDYYIATTPPDRWTWVSPNMLGVITNAGIVPLHHPVEDIFKKRADVRDYLLRQSPSLAGQYTSKCPHKSLQEIVREQKYREMSIDPNEVRTQMPANLTTAPGVSDLPVPQPMASFLEGFFGAIDPRFSGLTKSMLREGAWEEVQVAKRLGPERYKYWKSLRDHYTHLYSFHKISHDQWVQIERQLWRQMVREAGLTPEELVAKSPYADSVVQSVALISPHLGNFVQRYYENIKQSMLEEQRRGVTDQVQTVNTNVTKTWTPSQTWRWRLRQRGAPGSFAV